MKTNIIAATLLIVFFFSICLMVISYNQNETVFGIGFTIFLLTIVLTGAFSSDRT